jgi:hypothetical protein
MPASVSFLARLLAGPADRFPNPLIGTDPDFAAACSTHGEECLKVYREWTDAHGDEPAPVSHDPAERAAAVLASCARSYEILTKPVWDATDLARFGELYPVSLESAAFREAVAGRAARILLAVRTARGFLESDRGEARGGRGLD